MRLTEKQRQLVVRIVNGCGFITYYHPSGSEKGAWYIQSPYSNEDGRVCEGLLKKHGLSYIGDSDYTIAPAARDAAGL